MPLHAAPAAPPPYVTQWDVETEVIAVGGGQVYTCPLTNADTCRIHIYTTAGTLVDEWEVELGAVGAMAYYSGHLYVSQADVPTGNGPILRFNSDGASTHVFTTDRYVTSMAADSAGNLYFPPRSGDGVEVISNSGTFVKRIGETELDFAVVVGIDEQDNLFVAKDFPNRIVRFNSSGTFVQQWGEEGDGLGQLIQPEAIVIYNDYLYVADSERDKILVFSTDGTFITEWGESGTGNGQFSYPVDLALDSAGHLYVSDYSNSRIQVFDLSSSVPTVPPPSEKSRLYMPTVLS
jgi:DNA-binding beta-propeller fold protein YncE